MSQRQIFARAQSLEDRRTYMVIIGFVYSPLVLLLGAAAVIGIG